LISDAERYGWEWPERENPRACRTQVTRTAAIDRSNGKYRIATVETPRETLTIYISPTGKIRVFKSGVELK
jgi:hypothetical protein